MHCIASYRAFTVMYYDGVQWCKLRIDTHTHTHVHTQHTNLLNISSSSTSNFKACAHLLSLFFSLFYSFIVSSLNKVQSRISCVNFLYYIKTQFFSLWINNININKDRNTLRDFIFKFEFIQFIVTVIFSFWLRSRYMYEK